ncbi:VTT domain-containing protein [Sporolactobacillus nakayamae]|uniref:Membrane protein DedA, SNARE-associated domain n=1 Tax=Sporolactobacillus nakayamae TaxID=269670 RepID=A0A1I2PL75_9BACL|nr:VTT domain-containing protein [Sporolactobacillus nakayamae]SFG15889.1 membrane protein DedA, SNARE-associated domain [Sporolactobacillus nakayamae]
MSVLSQLLNEYGYLTLFCALMLELICIPIPNEALLSYVGILSFHGKMNLILSLLSAGSGGILGATLSYWIGYTLGVPFFRKFGSYIHMGPEKMERISKWYGKYGKVLLVFSFFIPGIRHIASIISGVIRLPFRSFCLFAYSGVFLWTGTFLSLGYVLGPQWDKYQGEIQKWLVLASIFFGIVLLCSLVIKANRRYIKESLFLLFQATFKRYRSFLKIKLFIFLILAAFISFITLMVGMIQNFISNEFTPFDKISRAVISFVADSRLWSTMQHISALSSWTVLSIILIFTIGTILVNNRDKWLELLFLGLTLTGGFLFSNGVRWLFRFMLTGSYTSADFPNERSMMVLIIIGYFLMMLVRHQKNYLISMIELVVLLFILLAYSVSAVSIFRITPSDLLAGYVFGAVWVSGLMLTLELFRFLSLIKKGLNH